MLRNYNFTEKDLKKMMPGRAAYKFAEKYCRNPTPARKKPSKANPEGSLAQPYEDILKQPWTPREFCDRCVEFVTSSCDKYGGLVNGEEVTNIDEAISTRDKMLLGLESKHHGLRNKHIENGYNTSHKLPEDGRDICLPDAFSDSITKVIMRKNQEVPVGSCEDDEFDNCHDSLGRIHKTERLIQQVAGDAAELRFLKSNKGATDTLIFPTFTHKVGDDFLCYDNNTKSFSGKDVKSSRFPKHFASPYKRFSNEDTLDEPMPTRAEALDRPEMALRRLYTEQGYERFSSAARLLLVRTPPGEPPSSVTSIRDQFKNFYTFKFEHKCGGKTVQEFEVKGAQIIFF